MTRVIIVRHGQSNYNTEKRIQGRSNASQLTEKGRHDAAKVGKALSNISFDAIYASPLRRAKSTAEIICNEFLAINPGTSSVSLQISDKLLEIDLPLWEGMVNSEVQEKFAEDYRTWHERPDKFVMEVPTEQGTREHFPILALYAQAREFWQELLQQHQGKTILIVGHNGINRALISTALGVCPSRYHSLQQSNCAISILNFAGGLDDNVQLESMNQTQHMGEALPTLRPGHHQGVRLLLVRHGETEWNRQGRFQGQIDIPLNDNGRFQASKAAEFLKDVNIDFAVSSTMARPKETAEIILGSHPNVELGLDAGLCEISHGLWEGKFEQDIEQEFPGELERWRTLPAEVQMPEGENLQQVYDRAVVAWQNIVQTAIDENRSVGLIVAHDATNKTLLCHILGLSNENFWNFRQGNGAVSVIDYPSGLNGLPVLQAMNITAHLGGGVLDKTAAGAL
ncbi:phosphoglycerate mutase [Calothrix sp. NIES-4101]|nr:phosphoglycerate mutase [Calothrix sp. NIES-4101]